MHSACEHYNLSDRLLDVGLYCTFFFFFFPFPVSLKHTLLTQSCSDLSKQRRSADSRLLFLLYGDNVHMLIVSIAVCFQPMVVSRKKKISGLHPHIFNEICLRACGEKVVTK